VSARYLSPHQVQHFIGVVCRRFLPASGHGLVENESGDCAHRAEVGLQGADAAMEMVGVGAADANGVVVVAGGVQRLDHGRLGAQPVLERVHIRARRQFDVDERLQPREGLLRRWRPRINDAS